jgi:polar amino acid transport system ATP-binding protein
MILVTHEIRFARDVADRVIFMDQGHIVEQGSAAEVIDRPRVERTRSFLGKVGGRLGAGDEASAQVGLVRPAR